MYWRKIWFLAVLLLLQVAAGAVQSDAEKNDSLEMNCTPDVPNVRRVVEGGVKVLFIGNSITLHPILPSVGWTNLWGMAASAEEKDYVHLVTAGIERETGRKADLWVRNLVDFERGFEKYDLRQIDDLVAYRPDYLVVSLGENVRPLVTEQDKLAYRTAFKNLLARFTYGRMKPNVVVKGAFWPNPGRDELMAHAASDLAMPFVATPCTNDSLKAKGLFAHAGVAAHPGDRGMAYMAEKVLEGFFPRESGFAVTVDGRPVAVRPIRVSRQPFNQWAPGYQRPVDQTEVAGLLRFETDGASVLCVKPLRAFKEAKVRPLSAKVVCSVKDGSVVFTLPKPGNYVLELDGWNRPLEIFAQPRRDFAAERKAANVVFGPGRHEPVVVKLKSHDRVYIDRGAVVLGSFQADGAEDVRVSGYGIICGSRNRRVGNNCYREGMDGAVRIIDSKNVVFDGPTVLDSSCWCVAAFNSRDITIKNLKVTGAWRYNTDGIDICNSQHVRVHDCYVHSFDDTLVVKGNPSWDGAKTPYDPVEDVRFERCVCWCGWGLTLEIGLETWAPRFRNVVFEDCDLIHNDDAALGVSVGGPDKVEDIVFRNIRIEYDRHDVARHLQTNRNHKIECAEPKTGTWFAAGNLGWALVRDRNGNLDRVTVENIELLVGDGVKPPTKRIEAASGTKLGRIDFRNVRVNGRTQEQCVCRKDGKSAVIRRRAADVFYPQKTIRFPGGGTTEFVATTNAFIGGSWWNREGGVTVFDCTNPSNLVCTSISKGCGYVTADPVSVPGTTFAVFPNWHSATVVDTADPANPRIVQTLGFDMSERTAVDLRRVGKMLLVQGDKSCAVYKWNDMTSRFAFVDKTDARAVDFPSPPPFDGRVKRWFSENDRKGVRFIGDNAYLFSRSRSSVSSYALANGRLVKLDEKFLIWGLPSVAIDGGFARIYAATAGGGHVLVSLDLKKEELVDFEPAAEITNDAKSKPYAVMGMRGSGLVVSAGGKIVTDGLAGGMSVDGTRVASARGSEFVVLDYAKGPRSTIVSRYAQTNLLQATGVALSGNILYAIAIPKATPRQTFLCTQPPDHSVLMVLDVSTPEARELARLDVPIATTCELVREGILYVPGIDHRGASTGLAIVDVSAPSRPKIVAKPIGVVADACYRIRATSHGVFLADGVRVKKLDIADPIMPKVAAEYVSNREVLYGVDDFDVVDGKLYAVSHASLAVYALTGLDGVAPKIEPSHPSWSEKLPAGFALRTTCEKKVALPEGECVASVVAQDGTVYVAAGYSGLAIVSPDGRVRYARHLGPRANYNYNYATGVALSSDGKRVCLFSGEGEGCYLVYEVDSL